MSEQNKNDYPEFYEPSNSETAKDIEHLILVNHKFNELFDRIMFDRIGRDVEVDPFDFRFGFNDDFSTVEYDSLEKNIEVDEQTYRLSLAERLKDRQIGDSEEGEFLPPSRDSEVFMRKIFLERIDDGDVRESFSYQLGADGIVRRLDFGDKATDMEQRRELDRIDRMDSDEDFFIKVVKRITNEMENNRLEEDMKLNNQPISLDEMQGLKDFLAEATDLDR